MSMGSAIVKKILGGECITADSQPRDFSVRPRVQTYSNYHVREQVHPGLWARWNRVMTERIMLVSEDGWVVVQKKGRAGTLVFVRVDREMQIERDSALC